MNILESIAVSGFVGTQIAVPVLRLCASIFLAIAVSSDCKSRRNGSSALWGVLMLVSPVFFGIIYFVYSRFFTDRKPETQKEKSASKTAKIMCLLSVFTYIVMLVVLIVSLIVTVSSSIAGNLL